MNNLFDIEQTIVFGNGRELAVTSALFKLYPNAEQSVVDAIEHHRGTLELVEVRGIRSVLTDRILNAVVQLPHLERLELFNQRITKSGHLLLQSLAEKTRVDLSENTNQCDESE